MRKIEEPRIDQREVCNSFSDLKYKERIIEKSIKYKEIISNVEESFNDENEFSNVNNEYGNYMKKMYSERFSNKQYAKIYKFYKEIRSMEKYCPYCNYPTREVKQIDHYLPKAKFPTLSIVVKNLVPICKECNEIKGEYYSFNKENQLIHPYYDYEMIDAFEYIECAIIEDSNIGFKFSIKKLESWNEIFHKKVIFHFEKLEIDKLYLSDFVTEFDVYFDELITVYECSKSKDIIKSLIKAKIDSYYKKRVMPWRYAGFKSLLENNWFFETFFN
ncbi:HNH endonuclease [Clostridium sp.]|uniref:HNH endonuclease n=1 Tax=Clostridium sp. TaxID=1506 RepID=UPI00290E5E00|nr:HNH endonuclease [Clostridium sp.]MDU7364110.1 HNH endonuclease [Clostridium sp.]